MARLFPLRSETPPQEGQPRVVDLEGEDADAVFSALSSTTARRIYTRLSEEPGTPSDVADAIDSSIQNVRYHLEKLEDAGLVEVVDTWYSSRGNEMSVYATADGPLIVTSDRSTADKLKTALSRYLGGIAALAGGSLLVQYGLERFFAPGAPADDAAPATEGDSASSPGDDGGNGNGIGTTEESEETAAEQVEEDTADAPPDEADPETEEDADGFTAATDDESEDDAEAGDDVDTASDQEVTDADAESDETDRSTAGDSSDDSSEYDVYTADDVPPADGNATVDGAPEAAEAIVAAIPPGMLFFLGGLVVLTVVTVYWYWTASSY